MTFAQAKIGVIRKQTLRERSIDRGEDVYINITDFEKAFGRVNWVKVQVGK